MSKEAALNMLSGNTTPTTAAAPEPVATPTPTETPKPTLDSERFARLAAKEAQLQKDREAYKAQVEALKPVKEQIDQFNELKKTDKIAALKLMGFTEEDIVNFIADQPEKKEPTPAELAAKAAQEELEKYKKEQLELKTKEQQERDERNIKAFKDGIGEAIAKDAEKYEYLNHYGAIAQDVVYETVLQFIKEDPNMTPLDALKEAMASVEEYYEEEMDKVIKLKKLQSKLSPVATETIKTEPQRKTVITPPRAEATPPSKPKVAPHPPVPPAKETAAQKRARLEEMLRNGGR